MTSLLFFPYPLFPSVIIHKYVSFLRPRHEKMAADLMPNVSVRGYLSGLNS